ncbi:MAG: hypothetical protein HY037_07760 [Nitrospirae bacterium]|nr:hypothetical protein [Candidatus Troglogloeales bacterium]
MILTRPCFKIFGPSDAGVNTDIGGNLKQFLDHPSGHKDGHAGAREREQKIHAAVLQDRDNPSMKHKDQACRLNRFANIVGRLSHLFLFQDRRLGHFTVAQVIYEQLLTSPSNFRAAHFAQNEKPVTGLHSVDRRIIRAAMIAGMSGFERLSYYVFLRFIRHGILLQSSGKFHPTLMVAWRRK